MPSMAMWIQSWRCLFWVALLAISQAVAASQTTEIAHLSEFFKSPVIQEAIGRCDYSFVFLPINENQETIQLIREHTVKAEFAGIKSVIAVRNRTNWTDPRRNVVYYETSKPFLPPQKEWTFGYYLWVCFNGKPFKGAYFWQFDQIVGFVAELRRLREAPDVMKNFLSKKVISTNSRELTLSTALKRGNPVVFVNRFCDECTEINRDHILGLCRKYPGTVLCFLDVSNPIELRNMQKYEGTASIPLLGISEISMDEIACIINADHAPMIVVKMGEGEFLSAAVSKENQYGLDNFLKASREKHEKSKH